MNRRLIGLLWRVHARISDAIATEPLVSRAPPPVVAVVAAVAAAAEAAAPIKRRLKRCRGDDSDDWPPTPSVVLFGALETFNSASRCSHSNAGEPAELGG